MPKLIDAIAKMSINNMRVNPQHNQQIAKNLSKTFSKENLMIRNRLKMVLQVGDVDKVVVMPNNSLNEKLFAAWNDNLNKPLNRDVFEFSNSLNTVKPSKDVYNEIEKAYQHELWLKEVDKRLVATLKSMKRSYRIPR